MIFGSVKAGEVLGREELGETKAWFILEGKGFGVVHRKVGVNLRRERLVDSSTLYFHRPRRLALESATILLRLALYSISIRPPNLLVGC